MWGVTPVATPEPCPWDAINDSLTLKVIPLADKEGRAEQFLHVYISQTWWRPLLEIVWVFLKLSCCFASGDHAVPRPAVGHSVLCVNPLHQPLQGQGCAAVRLRWRRQSHAEGGGTDGPVQKHPVSVVGLSAHVPRDAHYDSEVGIDHAVHREGGVIRVIIKRVT